MISNSIKLRWRILKLQLEPRNCVSLTADIEVLQADQFIFRELIQRLLQSPDTALEQFDAGLKLVSPNHDILDLRAASRALHMNRVKLIRMNVAFMCSDLLSQGANGSLISSEAAEAGDCPGFIF